MCEGAVASFEPEQKAKMLQWSVERTVSCFTTRAGSPDCGGVGGSVDQVGFERTEEGMGLLWVPAGCTPSRLCMIAVSVESMLVLLVSLWLCPASADASWC